MRRRISTRPPTAQSW